jgi:TusA-related sulfurtransferase
MRLVSRNEIQDYETYNDQRDEARNRIMTVKALRRIHVGEVLTFLFENAETLRYQIQEIMRAERIVREKDIQHEIDVYNEMLGGEGQLGCCLLIEIDDPAERQQRLREWRDLPRHLYMRFADGSTQPPEFDEAQMDEEKLSAVQYLKFTVGDRTPVALGSDLPALRVEATLTQEQQAALLADLAG